MVDSVVPDAVYAGMWRIDLGDGALSDMVNLSRAKEAAAMRADANATQAPRPCVKTIAPLPKTTGACGNALVAFGALEGPAASVKKSASCAPIVTQLAFSRRTPLNGFAVAVFF
jgi:hypothetical protein